MILVDTNIIIDFWRNPSEALKKIFLEETVAIFCNMTQRIFLLYLLDWRKDMMYAMRFNCKKQSWFKNFGSWFNGKAANLILKKPKDRQFVNFGRMAGNSFD